jgi:hypothetical protein
MGQPELIHQNCDLSHETEIISHKENWNRSQRLILNQPSVEWYIFFKKTLNIKRKKNELTRQTCNSGHETVITS